MTFETPGNSGKVYVLAVGLQVNPKLNLKYFQIYKATRALLVTLSVRHSHPLKVTQKVT